MIKVLFVNNSRGRGGGEEYLRALLPGLVGRGIEVHLLCRPDTPLHGMFGNIAVKLHTVRRSGINMVSALWKTSKLLRNNKYDIINIQRSHDVMQIWVAVMLAFYRPRLIYTVHVAKFIQSRFLLRRMDGVIAISEYIRDKLQVYVPELATRISIVHNGIDLNVPQSGHAASSTQRMRFALPTGARIIGIVGDLWKSQIEFLDALALIRIKEPNIRLMLVASTKHTPSTDEFNARARSLGLSDIIFYVGRLPKEEMAAWYAEIDLAVNMYRKEGFGLWILEALAMGVPVVSVDAGGVRDVLAGCPAGMLVNDRASDIADAVLRILGDPIIYARMAAAGSDWVASKFSRERMIDDYQKIFISAGNQG